MRIVFVFFLIIISCSPLKKYEETAAKWQKDISKLESLDQSEKYSENAILFIGSSSWPEKSLLKRVSSRRSG